MEQLKDQLQRLLNKSDWTDEEKLWLLDYLEHSDGEELMELAMQSYETEAQPGNVDEVRLQQILEMIKQRVGHEISQPVPVVKMRFNARRLLAAASVVGLLLLGVYALNREGAKKDVARATERVREVLRNDVLPGGNKATLTLADGSTIVLSDDQKGVLAQQGGATVSKTGGKLAYEQSGNLQGKVLYNSITTPRGGQYQIVLADGSAVWLNAASSLRFPTAFAGKERRVEITGEAYFEVAKNKDMPFIVSVNGAEVQVLGTHFNVAAYADDAELKTTLLEGSVRFVKGNNAVMLKPGQQSQLRNSGDVKVVSDVNVERVVSWKNGYFHFEGDDVESVVKQLSRWYDIEVIGADKIDDKFYAEIPRNTKLSDALKALELTGKVHFSFDGRRVTVKQ